MEVSLQAVLVDLMNQLETLESNLPQNPQVAAGNINKIGAIHHTALTTLSEAQKANEISPATVLAYQMLMDRSSALVEKLNALTPIGKALARLRELSDSN